MKRITQNGSEMAGGVWIKKYIRNRDLLLYENLKLKRNELIVLFERKFGLLSLV
jgi:hypothetical protein